MAKRMKTPAAPAITSLEELTARVGRFATLSAAVELRQAHLANAIAALKAEAAEDLLPIATEMKAILLAAKPWWAANAEQLTEGKRKSVALAGCLIGERMSQPSLAHPKPEETAIELIKGRQWPALLRVKEELDKPAIMKALGFEPPETADVAQIDAIVDAIDLRDTLELLGFSVAQKEEFFISRIADPVMPTETVADLAEQVAA